MTRLIGVSGALGCERGRLPSLRAQYPQTKLVFIEDRCTPRPVNGHEIVDWLSFLERDVRKKTVSIAIASSNTRQSIAEKCAAADVPLVEARGKWTQRVAL